MADVTEARPARFSRLPGDWPIYCLSRGSHMLYYAPGYLAAVAAGQEQTWMARMAAIATEDKLHPAGSQFAQDINGSSSTDRGQTALVARSLIDAAATAVQHRTSLIANPFRPLSLTLYLNHRCNLRCSYCYAMPLPSSPARLSIASVRRAARLIAGHCAAVGKPLTLVCHGGGEPTMDLDYLEQVLTAVETVATQSRVSLFRYIATNGVLPASKAAWIASRFDLIGLSCDGPPEIQDRQRPTWVGRSTSTTVERTAQILRDEGANFQVRLTATPATVDHLPDAVEYLCRRIRPRQIWAEAVYRGGRSHKGFAGDDAPHFAERFLAAREVASQSKIPLLTSGNRLDQLHGPYCSLLQGSLQLLPDGTANACFKAVRSDENGRGQTVYSQQDLDEFAIDQERSRQLLTTLSAAPATCRDCVNEHHCTYGCPDTCLLAGAAPANSFRCRLGQELTQRHLCTWGNALWARARLNSGVAGKEIAGWGKESV